MGKKPAANPDLDVLLTPTLQDNCIPIATEKPWRIESQFYVAFFGGVLPLTVIAYLNAKKLGVSERRRKQIVLFGSVALVAALVGVGLVLNSMSIGDLSHAIRDPAIRRSFRWGPRIAAILLYLPLRNIQKPAERVYLFNTGDEEPYASLWKAGLLAVLALGALQSFVFLVLIPLLV